MCDDEAGRVAYEAYCDSTGGRSAVSGAVLPAWGEQSAEIRAAWVAAAEAVKLRFGAIYG